MKRARVYAKACECFLDVVPKLLTLMPELHKLIDCWAQVRQVDAEASEFVMKHEARQQ